MNWDLLAVALATAATLAFFRRRDGWAGVLIGLGMAAKLYPGATARALRRRTAARAAAGPRDPPVVVGRGRLDRREPSLRFEGAVGMVGVLPIQRGPRGRLGQRLVLLCRHLSPVRPTGVINVASIVLLVALGLVGLDGEASARARLPSVAARVPVPRPRSCSSAKVYSPQFSLWLLPWLVLVLPAGPRRFLAFEAADVVVFLTRFSFFGDLTGVGGLPQWVFETAVVIRAAVLIWCVVAWVREPSRRLPSERRGRRSAQPAAHA